MGHSDGSDTSTRNRRCVTALAMRSRIFCVGFDLYRFRRFSFVDFAIIALMSTITRPGSTGFEPNQPETHDDSSTRALTSTAQDIEAPPVLSAVYNSQIDGQRPEKCKVDAWIQLLPPHSEDERCLAGRLSRHRATVRLGTQPF